MEALLFALYGLFLLYGPIRLLRDGGSRMLSLRVAPFLLLAVPVFPLLPRLYRLAAPAGRWPGGVALETAAPFWWAVGAACCGLFCACAVFQFLSGRGEARRDKWAIIESRAQAAMSAGNYRAALSQYEDALRTDPSNHAGHYRFARLLRRLGYLKRARGHYLLAVEHAPPEERETLARAAYEELSATQEGLREADAFLMECRRKGLADKVGE